MLSRELFTNYSNLISILSPLAAARRGNKISSSHKLCFACKLVTSLSRASCQAMLMKMDEIKMREDVLNFVDKRRGAAREFSHHSGDKVSSETIAVTNDRPRIMTTKLPDSLPSIAMNI